MFLLTLHPHLVGMRSRIGYFDDYRLHQVEAERMVRDRRPDREVLEAARVSRRR